jgi:catechol 2,3-dioxygenase-like lactoylglutathione lyase family enzyme
VPPVSRVVRILREMKLSIEAFKVYMPAKDFEVSKRFYQALGFTLIEAWNGNVDCCLGKAEFRLQHYYVKEWAENFMMQFWVEDVDTWYEHVRDVILKGRFDARATEPETVDGATICHVIDPSGILLIFINQPGT